jgi:hypothetical protein
MAVAGSSVSPLRQGGGEEEGVVCGAKRLR